MYNKQYTPQADDIKDLAHFEAHPLLYAHMILKEIIKAPKDAFSTGNIEAGFQSMIFYVNLLESVYTAEGTLKSDWIDDNDYKTELANLKNNYDGLALQTFTAQLKLKYILRVLFGQRNKEVEIIC